MKRCLYWGNDIRKTLSLKSIIWKWVYNQMMICCMMYNVCLCFAYYTLCQGQGQPLLAKVKVEYVRKIIQVIDFQGTWKWRTEMKTLCIPDIVIPVYNYITGQRFQIPLGQSITYTHAHTRVCIIAYSARACVCVCVIISIMYSRLWSEWKRTEKKRKWRTEGTKHKQCSHNSIYTYDSICNLSDYL